MSWDGRVAAGVVGFAEYGLCAKPTNIPLTTVDPMGEEHETELHDTNPTEEA